MGLHALILAILTCGDPIIICIVFDAESIILLVPLLNDGVLSIAKIQALFNNIILIIIAMST